MIPLRLILIASALALGGLYAWERLGPKDCYVADAIVRHDRVDDLYVKIGDSELCGRDLEAKKGIVGPSLIDAYHKANERVRELEATQE